MAVWDFDEGKRYYERLLGATFEAIDDDGEAAAFGVRAEIAWDAGVELVSPIEGMPSPLRTDLERSGEGLKGVVFAVADADEAMANGRELGLAHYYFLDYDEAELQKRFGTRYTRYKEYFVGAKPPLSGTILLGEFDT